MHLNFCFIMCTKIYHRSVKNYNICDKLSMYTFKLLKVIDFLQKKKTKKKCWWLRWHDELHNLFNLHKHRFTLMKSSAKISYWDSVFFFLTGYATQNQFCFMRLIKKKTMREKKMNEHSYDTDFKDWMSNRWPTHLLKFLKYK